MDFLFLILDPQIVVSGITAVAVFATIITLGYPYLRSDRLASRLDSVARERERLKAKQREELLSGRGNLRSTPATYMANLVTKLNLREALSNEKTKLKLTQAGFRGEKPLITFLFFRVVTPIIMLFAAIIYLFVLNVIDQPDTVKAAICLGAAYLGFYFPNLFITNLIQKRQQSISEAFPDALDLLLICVEAGMSIEAAFNKVAEEIGSQSIELAEELSLTTAELSYLQERRQAFENIGIRTGLPGVKAVGTSLVQAERYGTRLGTALRVMAQENRDMRMAEAEKKAAALPAQLTVPMIVFFLPVLFVVILGPAIIQVMQTF